MKASERKKLRHRTKSRARQALYRERQRDKGLALLQVRVSRLAHSKAIRLCELNGISLTDFYQLAFANTDLNALPLKHVEVTSGDLTGTLQISPWIEKSAAERFEEMAINYKNRTIAMSAIIYAYCMQCES